MKKFIVIMLLVSLFGCKSEEEQVREKQKDVCTENVKNGQEPTEFCINLNPDLARFAPARMMQGQEIYQQTANVPIDPQQPMVQQYVPQQPMVQPQQPVVVQNGSSTGDTIRDMAIGGMIGHALGSIGNNGSNYSSNFDRRIHDSYSPNVTKNVTIIQKQNVPNNIPSSVPKQNYMDTSKLSSYGARPSVSKIVPKSSSMNMSKLSTYGKRK